MLTGLVFVALSLNVNVVTQDATHRYRAIDTLTAMTGIFVICAFALMGGQDHRAVGIEWLVVAAISIAVYLHGYVQAVRRGGSIAWLRRRSDRCRCALPHPNGRRSVARRRPNRRAVCRRGSDGRRNDAHDLGRMALTRRCDDARAEALRPESITYRSGAWSVRSSSQSIGAPRRHAVSWGSPSRSRSHRRGRPGA